jgi:arsenate reductase-like glutaredoxin family protein
MVIVSYVRTHDLKGRASPILIDDGFVLVGFKEAEWKDALRGWPPNG